jgi:hypothetical protein
MSEGLLFAILMVLMASPAGAAAIAALGPLALIIIALFVYSWLMIRISNLFTRRYDPVPRTWWGMEKQPAKAKRLTRRRRKAVDAAVLQDCLRGREGW